MPTPYQLEAAHERRQLKKGIRTGYQGVRSAGSRGKIDLVYWNMEELVLIASQRVPWHPNKMKDVIENSIIPPFGRLIFTWIENGRTKQMSKEEAEKVIASYKATHPDD